MAVYELRVVFVRECRTLHRLAVCYGKGSYLIGRTVAARLRPHYRVLAGFGYRFPVAVGYYYHWLLQAFGLVDRCDLYGVVALFDAQALVRPPLVPPFEIQLYVGYAVCAERYDLLVHGLQIGYLIPLLMQRVSHYDALERLFGRELRRSCEEIQFLRRQLLCRVASEIAVVYGALDRQPAVYRQPQYGDDERYGTRAAYGQRILRHDVEARPVLVAEPRMLVFE